MSLRHRLPLSFLVASVALSSYVRADVFHMAPGLTNVELVTVDDPGNPPDTRYNGISVGSVNYFYQIGKYEVTVGQYTAFLNAVAATDTYSLYSTNMATDLNIAGIAQSCVAGSCNYSVIGSPNHPVTYVSWGDAARFANWLQNGQPTGAEGPGTTETGTYALNGATSSSALLAVARNVNAKWVIPTEDEWYKAAYYQPAANGGDPGGYWLYPMKTNSVPYSDQPPGATPDNTRVGNFYQDDGLANGYNDGFAVTGSTMHSLSQNYLTDVGAYNSTPNYYGTFDQGGNVFEWTDTAIFDLSRIVRGGSWNFISGGLHAGFRYSDVASYENFDQGFRIASIPVPEPGAGIMAILACGLGLLWRALPRRTLGGRQLSRSAFSG